jgi:peptidoglycan/xylan/chitin deacetylase (PgdA/CDA1 family)
VTTLSKLVTGAWAATTGAALVYLVPSVLILPTFARRCPSEVARGACRWRWSTGDDAVCVTFDDGPAPATLTTLGLLEELEMRATFFALGQQILAHPEITRQILDRGHDLASHGFEHRSSLLRSPGAIRRDLRAAMSAHEEVLGERPRFYRPPYGHVSLATLFEARRHGLQLVMWSRWGKEFAERRPEAVLERLEPGLVPGAVLLLHDNDVSCRPGTAALTHAVLPGLKDLLSARGLRTVALREMAHEAGDLRAA